MLSQELFSAVAAQFIDHEKEVPYAFQIRLPVDRENTCTVPDDSSLADDSPQKTFIVWDETVMTRRRSLETADRTLRDTPCANLLFGWITVLHVHDFREILPVVQMGTKSRIDEVYFNWSKLAVLFLIYHLHWIMCMLVLGMNGTVSSAILHFPVFSWCRGKTTRNNFKTKWSANHNAKWKRRRKLDKIFAPGLGKQLLRLPMSVTTRDYNYV